MPTFKCPECENEITYLDYTVGATAYGTYNIEEGNTEEEEVEESGERIYKCPECGEELRTDQIIRENNEQEVLNREAQILRTAQEERNNRPQPQPPWGMRRTQTPNPDEDNPSNNRPIEPAIEQSWRGQYSGYHNSHDTRKQIYILTCPSCGHKTEAEEKETITCQKCNKAFNKETAKNVIEITT